jgi:hypothetical protein
MMWRELGVAAALALGAIASPWYVFDSPYRSKPIADVLHILQDKLKRGASMQDRFDYARACTLAYAFPARPFVEFEPAVINGESQPQGQADSTALFFLQESVHAYERLVQDEPQEAHYWLGLGYSLEKAADEAAFMPNLKVRGQVLGSAKGYRQASLSAYRECLRLASSHPVRQASPCGPFEPFMLVPIANERVLKLTAADSERTRSQQQWAEFSDTP